MKKERNKREIVNEKMKKKDGKNERISTCRREKKINEICIQRILGEKNHEKCTNE